MKINKKKVVKMAIETSLTCCCMFLVPHIEELAFTKWLPRNLACALGVTAMVAVALVLVALFVFLILVAEVVFSDDFQEELAKLEKASEAEAESQTKVAIRSNHGDSLKEVMEAIRHEKWEYYAFFNLSGQKLAEGTYQSAKTCNITKEDWQRLKQCREEAIGLHNHPGTYNGSFSEEDFAAFLQYDFIRQFIVVTKKYNYVLKKTANGYEKFQDEARTYAGEMFAKYLWLEILSGRLWTVLVSLKTAKRFGLEFRIEHVPRPATQKNAFRIGLATCAILAFCLAGYRPLPESSPLSPAPTVTATAVASSTKTGSTLAVDIYDDAHAISGSIDCPSGKDPANDPCFQGNAPVGGGPNYN